MALRRCVKCAGELPDGTEVCPVCGRRSALSREARRESPLQEKYDSLARRAKAQAGNSRWADIGKGGKGRTGDHFLTSLIIFCVFFIILYEIYFLVSGR